MSILLLFFNWYMLYLALAVAAGAAIIYFTQGPVVLVRDACDWHTWALIIAAAIGVTLFSSQHQIESLKQENTTLTQDNGAGKDGGEVASHLDTKKSANAARAQDQRDAVEAAPAAPPQEDKMDALLDKIEAQEDGDAAP